MDLLKKMDKYHKLTKEQESYLDNLYTNTKSSVSYSSPYALYKHIKNEGKHKIPLSQIKKWLQTKDTYTLFKEPRNQNKQTYKYIPETINSDLDIDISHIPHYEKENDGYSKFILLIDIFSKKVYTEPVKNLTADEIISAFKKIIEKNDTGIPFRTIRSDAGQEFSSKKFIQFLKNSNINHVTMRSSISHANYSERALRTLKRKIYQFLYENNTHRWVDV